MIAERLPRCGRRGWYGSAGGCHGQCALLRSGSRLWQMGALCWAVLWNMRGGELANVACSAHRRDVTVTYARGDTLEVADPYGNTFAVHASLPHFPAKQGIAYVQVGNGPLPNQWASCLSPPAHHAASRLCSPVHTRSPAGRIACTACSATRLRGTRTSRTYCPSSLPPCLSCPASRAPPAISRPSTPGAWAPACASAAGARLLVVLGAPPQGPATLPRAAAGAAAAPPGPRWCWAPGSSWCLWSRHTWGRLRRR